MKVVKKTLLISVLIIVTVVTVFPFYRMAVVGLSKGGFGMWGLSLLPERPTVENFIKLFERYPMFQWILNTTFYAGFCCIVTLPVDALVAYAIAKGVFPGRDFIFILLLTAIMIPGQAILIPLFQLMTRLHLIDTLWSLILPNIASTSGFFIMRQYMLGLPDEVILAGKVDGCSEFGVFWRIVLPMSKPALLTVMALRFIGNWNSFLFPLVMLRSKQNYTLPVGIAALSWWGMTPWGLVMAGSVISILPTIIVFLLLQREIIAGIVIREATGVKG